jgi:hypothetical protein
MTDEDLELVVAATGHARYREVTDPAHPDYRPAYREVVAREAARLRGEATPAEPPLPSLGRQVAGLAGAAVRVVAAAVQGEAVQVAPEVYDARLAICRGDSGRPPCDRYRASDGRCSECGCYLPGAKAMMATEDCPLGRWPAP